MEKQEKPSTESKSTNPKNKPRPYEAVLILQSETPIDEQKEILRKSKNIILNFKGSVFSLDTWGKRNLANPIKKNKKGIYFHYLFEALPGSIMEMERNYRINDRVLRYMNTSLDSRIPLSKHAEAFKTKLQESAQREKEREAKFQARRSAMAADRE